MYILSRPRTLSLDILACLLEISYEVYQWGDIFLGPTSTSLKCKLKIMISEEYGSDLWNNTKSSSC